MCQVAVKFTASLGPLDCWDSTLSSVPLRLSERDRLSPNSSSPCATVLSKALNGMSADEFLRPRGFGGQEEALSLRPWASKASGLGRAFGQGFFAWRFQTLLVICCLLINHLSPLQVRIIPDLLLTSLSPASPPHTPHFNLFVALRLLPTQVMEIGQFVADCCKENTPLLKKPLSLSHSRKCREALDEKGRQIHRGNLELWWHTWHWFLFYVTRFACLIKAPFNPYCLL